MSRILSLVEGTVSIPESFLLVVVDSRERRNINILATRSKLILFEMEAFSKLLATLFLVFITYKEDEPCTVTRKMTKPCRRWLSIMRSNIRSGLSIERTH